MNPSQLNNDNEEEHDNARLYDIAHQDEGINVEKFEWLHHIEANDHGTVD